MVHCKHVHVDRQGSRWFMLGGFYLCTLKKDATLLRTPQKLVVIYMPSLELFFSLTLFRRHLLLTVGNGSGE